MKLLPILITWFIVSIPAGIVLGCFCAIGNGFRADGSSCPEEEPDTLAETKTLKEHPARKAA